MIFGDPKSSAKRGSTVGSGAPCNPTTLFDPMSKSIASRYFLAVSLPLSTSNLISCDLSAIEKSVNGSTIKPFLNLSRPVLPSLMVRPDVFCSSIERVVCSSKLSILVSKPPISFIV